MKNKKKFNVDAMLQVNLVPDSPNFAKKVKKIKEFLVFLM